MYFKFLHLESHKHSHKQCNNLLSSVDCWSYGKLQVGSTFGWPRTLTILATCDKTLYSNAASLTRKVETLVCFIRANSFLVEWVKGIKSHWDRLVRIALTTRGSERAIYLSYKPITWGCYKCLLIKFAVWPTPSRHPRTKYARKPHHLLLWLHSGNAFSLLSL